MRNRFAHASKNKYNIKQIDFISFKKSQKQSDEEKVLSKPKKKFGFGLIGRFFLIIIGSIIVSIKFYSAHFGKLKKNLSRKVFFGRGFYFQVFSNISTVFILIFGALIYLSTDTAGKENDFISKYSGIKSDTNVLYAASSGETTRSAIRLSPINYTVQDGDTLSTIAEKLSDELNRVSVDSIKWANGLETSTDIRPGLKLVIPPIQGTIHTVAEGESLDTIAVLHNRLTQEQIDAALSGDENAQILYNGFKQEIIDSNLLAIKVQGDERIPQIASGQMLIIPNGSISVPDPTPPPVTPAPYTPPKVAANPPPNTVSVVPAQPRGDVGFIWPVAGGSGIISQYFSPWHTAVDIANASGPALLAVASGTVITTGWEDLGCGFVVRVQHDNGYTTTNCHTRGDLLQVSTGQRVVQGQILTYMGCSGSCTGTHVHFMVKTPGGALVDPLGYIFR